MKEGRLFIDTNLIVYTYDSSAGAKHLRAVEIMKDVWSSGQGIVSMQVLQEFFVTVTRKISKPLDIATANEILHDLMKLKTVTVDKEIILKAIDIQKEHKYSFWDSAIIAAAVEGGATTLLSEDLSDRHAIRDLVIRNPFAAASG
ncbi:MAG: PIN domain-containing protein [Thermodesulfovibrionales bacterium]